MQLFWDPEHGTAEPRHRCDLMRIYLDADTGDLSVDAAFILQHTYEPEKRRLSARENAMGWMRG